MASIPSSVDSGYVTGGTESRGGHFDKDIDRLSSDTTKDIAPWIHPTIRGLCNELGAPAAVRYILAGITSPPSKQKPRESKERHKKNKIPALIGAVYLHVRTRLSQRATGCWKL
jgi:hypothetical protein